MSDYLFLWKVLQKFFTLPPKWQNISNLRCINKIVLELNTVQEQLKDGFKINSKMIIL